MRAQPGASPAEETVRQYKSRWIRFFAAVGEVANQLEKERRKG
jgi:hypothetical protein